MDYKRFANFKLLSEGSGGFEGYASLFGVRDDGGDVVEQGAFGQTLPQFIKNGFISLGHDWDGLPLGVIADAREDDKGLFIKAQYHSTAEAQAARQVAQERMTAGKSVGLSIGYGIKPGGMELAPDGMTRQLKALDLYEVAQVNVPMLRPAGLTSVKSHETKKAIASHSTATSDGAWDGPANEARLSNDAGAATFRKAFAWVDPNADPDTKAAYKFIHHEVSSDGTVGAANMRACLAGIAVLNGGRGGTTIPDADKQGVYNHLARHLRDGDREPPDLKSLAGLSYADHAEHVLADVQAFVARSEDLATLRARERGKAGAVLNATNRQRMQSMMDSLDELRTLIKQIMDEATGAEKSNDSDGLYLEFQRTLARLNGVQVGV